MSTGCSDASCAGNYTASKMFMDGFYIFIGQNLSNVLTVNIQKFYNISTKWTWIKSVSNILLEINTFSLIIITVTLLLLQTTEYFTDLLFLTFDARTVST